MLVSIPDRHSRVLPSDSRQSSCEGLQVFKDNNVSKKWRDSKGKCTLDSPRLLYSLFLYLSLFISLSLSLHIIFLCVEHVLSFPRFPLHYSELFAEVNFCKQSCKMQNFQSKFWHKIFLISWSADRSRINRQNEINFCKINQKFNSTCLSHIGSPPLCFCFTEESNEELFKCSDLTYCSLSFSELAR